MATNRLNKSHRSFHMVLMPWVPPDRIGRKCSAPAENVPARVAYLAAGRESPHFRWGFFSGPRPGQARPPFFWHSSSLFSGTARATAMATAGALRPNLLLLFDALASVEQARQPEATTLLSIGRLIGRTGLRCGEDLARRVESWSLGAELTNAAAAWQTCPTTCLRPANWPLQKPFASAAGFHRCNVKLRKK